MNSKKPLLSTVEWIFFFWFCADLLLDNSYSTYYLSRGSLDMPPLIAYRSFVRLLPVVLIRRGKLNFPVLPLSCRQTPSVSVFRASFFSPTVTNPPIAETTDGYAELTTASTP